MPARKLRYMVVLFSLPISSMLGCQTAPVGTTSDSGASGQVRFESGTSLNESIRGVLAAPDTSSPTMR
jgi:hypothetical protein